MAALHHALCHSFSERHQRASACCHTQLLPLHKDYSELPNLQSSPKYINTIQCSALYQIIYNDRHQNPPMNTEIVISYKEIRLPLSEHSAYCFGFSFDFLNVVLVLVLFILGIIRICQVLGFVIFVFIKGQICCFALLL